MVGLAEVRKQLYRFREVGPLDIPYANDSRVSGVLGCMVLGFMAGILANPSLAGGLRLFGAACAARQLQTPLARKAGEEWLHAQSGLRKLLGSC